MYLLVLKAQDKGKMKLPVNMQVFSLSFLFLFLPGYNCFIYWSCLVFAVFSMQSLRMLASHVSPTMPSSLTLPSLLYSSNGEVCLPNCHMLALYFLNNHTNRYCAYHFCRFPQITVVRKSGWPKRRESWSRIFCWNPFGSTGIIINDDIVMGCILWNRYWIL